jgi:hypothetical protein
MGVVETLASLVTPSGQQRRALNKALVKAFWANDIPGMEKLVAEGADINYRPKTREEYPRRTRLLILAVEKRNPDMIRALLKMGADTEATDAYGRTALHQAAFDREDGSEAAVLLLQAGANPNSRYDGETPMHCAMRTFSIGTASALAPVADLTARDDRGLTPADNVGRSNPPEVANIARALATGDMSGIGGRELTVALTRGGPNCIAYFLDKGISLNLQGGAALSHALEGDEPLRTVRELLALGADPGAGNGRAIEQALIQGDSVLIEPFLEAGLDPGVLAARAASLIRRRPEIADPSKENAVRAAWLMTLAEGADPALAQGPLPGPRLSRKALNSAQGIKELRARMDVTPDKPGS